MTCPALSRPSVLRTDTTDDAVNGGYCSRPESAGGDHRRLGGPDRLGAPHSRLPSAYGSQEDDPRARVLLAFSPALAAVGSPESLKTRATVKAFAHFNVHGGHSSELSLSRTMPAPVTGHGRGCWWDLL